MPDARPRFFKFPNDFRAWMQKHHDQAPELLVGFYKKDSGKASITWPESVDVALCFGWIDGVRKRIDDASYTIRFTPRRPGSTWSAVNVKRVHELGRASLMAPAGRKAFEKREAAKIAVYSYDRTTEPNFSPFDAQFRANRRAWEFFQSTPPSYRRKVAHWVVSAKNDETKRRRLTTLIAASDQARRLDERPRGK